MIRLLFLCLIAFAGPALAESQKIALGDRYYQIDLPPGRKAAPIILALHGGGGNPEQFANNNGFSRPANAKGYAVIYPAGSARGRLNLLTWNGGYCCGYAAKSDVDDIGFLDAVIADATRRFGLNGDRVYLTGMSNGSMMAERYGALRAGRVRAVAGVSGTMDVKATRIKGPVPLLHIHGTADPMVPFGGGRGEDSLTKTNWASVDQLIAAFVRAAGGRLTATTQTIDPANDGMQVVRTDYSTVRGKVMVRLMTVEGGGHAWPGSRRSGKQGGTADIDGNSEVLQFFALHP